MSCEHKISVIIPISKDEQEHHQLLAQLPSDMEIIISSEGSRAKSLNIGAAKATGEYLWFLHADSRLHDSIIECLKQKIEQCPDSLLYFDLAFYNAPWIMKLNTFGANFRSRILRTPFGDQGLCIKKETFQKLGGFLEGLEYGEDHVFVINARQQGIDIQSVGTKLYTSARKYKKYGWLKTTFLHQYLWIKQALQESIK